VGVLVSVLPGCDSSTLRSPSLVGSNFGGGTVSLDLEMSDGGYYSFQTDGIDPEELRQASEDEIPLDPCTSFTEDHEALMQVIDADGAAFLDAPEQVLVHACFQLEESGADLLSCGEPTEQLWLVIATEPDLAGTGEVPLSEVAVLVPRFFAGESTVPGLDLRISNRDAAITPGQPSEDITVEWETTTSGSLRVVGQEFFDHCTINEDVYFDTLDFEIEWSFDVASEAEAYEFDLVSH
jgi:hypothetical protein